MKKQIYTFYISIFTICLLVSRPSLAQEAVQQPATKLDKFTSKSGVIIKFEDYMLPKISQQYGVEAETRIRKVHSGEDVKLFYQLSNTTKYGSKVASVAQEDFVELSKALISLKSQLATDEKSAADYLENRYVTADGLQLGYLISQGKVTWYIELSKYGNGGSIFMKSTDSLEDSFKSATAKLSELK